MMEIADHNKGNIIEAVHHNKPITFGFAVNKRIGAKMSLESGLQYTYLKSNFQLGSKNYCIDKEQRLHYLGVPVRLSYQFVGSKSWSMYSSTGLTLHIPMFGNTTADYITSGTSVYTDSKKKLPPVQWTINTSLGMQYQFAPNFNVFVEPTLNWYVPNGSNINNVWTERPVTFTIPFGIRFTW